LLSDFGRLPTKPDAGQRNEQKQRAHAKAKPNACVS
jgi:hypothetical protein